MTIRHFFVSFLLFALLTGSAAASPDGESTEELAVYMGDLQRFTHKLSLSVNAGNAALVRFYLHESLELLEEVQEYVPEYEDKPIALFMDRFILPAYQNLNQLMKENRQAIKPKDLQGAMMQVIDGCNQCHQATHHGFIKITEAKTNPFNQDFNP